MYYATPLILLVGLGDRCSSVVRHACRMLPQNAAEVLALGLESQNECEINNDPRNGGWGEFDQLIADSTSQAIVAVGSLADEILLRGIPALAATSAQYLSRFAFVLHTPAAVMSNDARAASIRADVAYVVLGDCVDLEGVVVEVALHWLRCRNYPDELVRYRRVAVEKETP